MVTKNSLINAGFNFMCNVDRIEYTVATHSALLYLPENNVPDMGCTILCFMAMDPAVKRIDVLVANVLRITYAKTDADTWNCTTYGNYGDDDANKT